MLHSAERLNNMGYISAARPDWILRTTYLFFYTASIQYLSCLPRDSVLNGLGEFNCSLGR